MAGWDKSEGNILTQYLSEDELWSLFNYVFSESSKKRSTYKFGLIKSILDNLFNTSNKTDISLFISYQDLFTKFTENYWNLIVKYELRQMIVSTTSKYTKIEQIFNNAIQKEPNLKNIPFESISSRTKQDIINQVANDCRKNVIGALYEDLGSSIYAFNLSGEGIFLNAHAFNFMLKYKTDIEKLNYYTWAKFLEKINNEEKLIKVISKLELATPHRSDLSIFREVLYKEFEEQNCFYCGKKLNKNTNITSIHVDHFIPWSFIKEDKLWNFVLSCPSCNENKSNRLPPSIFLLQLKKRNSLIKNTNIEFVKKEFSNYTSLILDKMWKYAKNSGYQIWNKIT